VTDPVADAAQEAAVAAVVVAITKAREIWDDFVAAVDHAVSTWPALREVVMGPFATLTAKVSEALGVLGRLVTERGDATAVRQVASDWTNLVGHRTSVQAGLLDRGQLPSQGQWTGAAADKYLTVVLNQRQALIAVKTITDNLQTTLNEVADEIRAFWIYLAAETAAWLAIMVTCVFTAAIGGTPAALVASAAYVGVVLKQCVDFDNALARLRQKIEQQSTVNDAFAGENWPPVQSEHLSDASVNDGDASAWTPNT
jgi:uncharacterized protein YukE